MAGLTCAGLVCRYECTWYYASPTMHQGYVEEAKRRFPSGNNRKVKIRFIANAAGALLPALASKPQNITPLPLFKMAPTIAI